MATTQQESLITLIKKELDVDTFLNTLTVESAIDHFLQLIISGWFLLKLIGIVFYLLTTQIFKWGQPIINKITTKLYLVSKPIDNPVSQFIAGLFSPKEEEPLPTKVNKSTFVTQSLGFNESFFINEPTKLYSSTSKPDMDSQKK